MRKYIYLFSILFFMNAKAMNAPVANLINAINRLDVKQCREILNNISLSRTDRNRCLGVLNNKRAHGENWEDYNLLYNISKIPLEISAVITAVSSIAILLLYFIPKEKNKKKNKVFLDNGNINTLVLGRLGFKLMFYIPCSITALLGTITAILWLLRNNETYRCNRWYAISRLLRN